MALLWRALVVLVIGVVAAGCLSQSSAATAAHTAEAPTTSTTVYDATVAALTNAVTAADPARSGMAPAEMVTIAKAVCASLRPGMTRMDVVIAGATAAINLGVPPDKAMSWTEISIKSYCPGYARTLHP